MPDSCSVCVHVAGKLAASLGSARGSFINKPAEPVDSYERMAARHEPGRLSSEFQWLPTDFVVSIDGSVAIPQIINNL